MKNATLFSMRAWVLTAFSAAVGTAMIIGLAGCSLFGLTSVKNPLTSVDASAILSGAAAGSGAVADSSLQRTVTLVNHSPNSDVQIGSTATIFDLQSGDTYLRAAIPVTNVGTKALSFVELSNLYYEDSSGAKLNSTPTEDFVSGSVGIVRGTSSNLFIDSCLAPGQTGYVILIQNGVFSSTSTIEFSLATGASTPADPGAALIPESYSVSGTSNGTLSVSFKNTGANQLDVNNNNSSLFRIVGLDSAGNSVFWDTLASNLNPSNGIVAAGQSGSVDDITTFAGSYSKVIVLLSFEVPAMAKSLAPYGQDQIDPSDYSDHEAWLAAVNQARNTMESQQRVLAGN
ncbi:MAG TPA: hypothetical protein VMW69_02805 [Spirochaetia bacterium]|nr:hypothetical protein [Spirochaetia bacterium]